MATAKSKVNKSEWIRSQPSNMPAAEVVEKAKREGIAISTAQVYTARSEAKKKAGGKPRRAQGGGGGGHDVGNGIVASGSIEAIIRQIVRDEIRSFFNR